MSEKSAKGQKIGRNSRSSSSKLQAGRTERNKRKSLERNPQGARGENTHAGRSQFIFGQPVRLSRIPALTSLSNAKTVRIAAQREANAVDVNAGFRLEFADKLINAVAAQRRVSVKDFKLAQKFRNARVVK